MQEPAGRLDDVTRLVSVVERGRCAVIAGPMGVGKSALLERVSQHALRAGVPVVAIACHAAAARIPFGALVGTVVDDSGALTAQLSSAIEALRGRKRTRLLITVDDINHIDPMSVAVLHRVLEDPNVMLISTIRSREEIPAEVIDLWRQVDPERIELGPVTIDAATMIVAERLDVDPGNPTAIQLALRSDGNPLFAVELAKAHLSGADTGLTPHLVGLVGQRLEALDVASKKMLTMVAIGQPLDASLPILDIDRLGDLEAGGLVLTETDDDGDILVRAAHPVYADAIRTQLTPLQRHSLTRQLATALAEQPRRRRGDALRIVNWLLDAGDRPAPDLAQAAAYEALGWLDTDLALHLATIAVEGGRTPKSLQVLGEVHRVSGNGTDAAEIWSEAFELATDDHDIHSLAISLAGLNALYLRTNAGAVDVLDEAFKRVNDPALRLGLEAEALLRRARQSSAEFIENAERILDDPACDDVAARSMLNGVLWMCATSGDYSRIDDFAARAAVLERRLPPEYDGDVDLTRAIVLSTLTFRQDIEVVLQRGAEWLAEAKRRRIAVGVSTWAIGYALFTRGELDSAEATLSQSLDMLARNDRFNLTAMVNCQLAMCSAALGSLDAARLHYERAMEPSGDGAPFLNVWAPRARAWLAAAHGDTDAAAEHALTAGVAALESGDVSWGLMACHDAVQWGAADAAVVPMDRMAAATSEAPLLQLLVEHAHAAAASDVARLEACFKGFGAANAWLLAAGAASNLALATTDEVAAKWASNARACAPTLPMVSDTDDLALSARQLDVVRLVAAGGSSKDAADALFISTRTVDNHLRWVFKRLDIHSRAELLDVITFPPPHGDPPVTLRD